MDNISFDEIYTILKSCFEPILYRKYEKQKELLKNYKYNIMTYKKDNKIVGFLSYWKIDENNFFVEHFAVDKNYQGQGIGKSLFSDFLKLKGDKCLEVEPPHTDIDKKRIKLYESFGFIFHEELYYQPPYNKGDNKTRLHIMSTKKLNDNDFNDLVKKIYTTVYNFKY